MTRQVTVKVSIYGTEYVFKTDDPQYVQALAKYVDEQIQKIESSRKISSPAKVITLAAFNIADELLRIKQEKEGIENTIAERLNAMLEMAEEASRPPGIPNHA